MKIAILSREKNSYSTKRLAEAGEKLGCKIDVLDYLSCYISINCKNSTIFYGDYELSRYDAIIPRIGPSKTFYGTSVVRQFETLGTYSINPSIAITRSRDKLRSLQILAMKGVDMPITGIAHSLKDTDYLLKSVGGAPVVIKLIEGTQGVGVVLAETTKAAESVMQAFMGLKANIIIQEYIEEAQGSDLRCIVLGDKVIAAMTRHAEPGEFRSNVHQGGSTRVAKITKEERAMAIKAVKILGLSFAGVDILRSNRGPLIMEVNSSPGLRGIEKATKKELAEMVIEYIIKNTKLNKKYYG